MSFLPRRGAAFARRLAVARVCNSRLELVDWLYWRNVAVSHCMRRSTDSPSPEPVRLRGVSS
jgi:hypothetical protein